MHNDSLISFRARPLDTYHSSKHFRHSFPIVDASIHKSTCVTNLCAILVPYSASVFIRLTLIFHYFWNIYVFLELWPILTSCWTTIIIVGWVNTKVYHKIYFTILCLFMCAWIALHELTLILMYFVDKTPKFFKVYTSRREGVGGKEAEP